MPVPPRHLAHEGFRWHVDAFLFEVSLKSRCRLDFLGSRIFETPGFVTHECSRPRSSRSTWFYATYLLSGADPDIPITDLQRELGVTYKTAWRMTHLICGMLSDGGEDEFVEDESEAAADLSPAVDGRQSLDVSDETETGSGRPSGLFRRITRRN